jgi:hypothetical protein
VFFTFPKQAILGIEYGCLIKKFGFELIGLLLVVGNMKALDGPLCNGAGGSLHVLVLGLMALDKEGLSDIASGTSNIVYGTSILNFLFIFG